MQLDRFDWLALRREEALDSERPIVDAHHHLWARRQWGGRMASYLAPQLLEDMTGSHNVVKSVFVDCRANYDPEHEPHMQPVGETAFVAGEADAADAAGGPTIAGIVSHADLPMRPATGGTTPPLPRSAAALRWRLTAPAAFGSNSDRTTLPAVVVDPSSLGHTQCPSM